MDSSQENDPSSWESVPGTHFDIMSPFRSNSASFPTAPQATLQAFTTAQLSDGQFQQLTTMAGAFQPTYQAAVSSSYERVSPVEDFATEVTPSGSTHGLQLVDGRAASRPMIASYPGVPLLMTGLTQQQFPLTTSAVSLPNHLGGIGLAATPLGGTAATGLYVIADSSGRALTQIPVDGVTSHPGNIQQVNARQLYTVVNYPPPEPVSEATTLTISGDQEADQTVSSLNLTLEQPGTASKELTATFTAQSTPSELGTDAPVFAPPESTNTFPGASTPQLELGGGQINLVVAENSQTLTSVLGAGLHAQQLTNTLGTGRLMDTSLSTGQAVAAPDQSAAESDLAEMLAIGRNHGDGMPMAEMDRDEETDGIGSHEQTTTAVRKSQRIANMEHSPSPAVRPTYLSKAYDVNELWCEDCQTSYTTSCSHHQQQPIYDKLVVSRAWASLPPQLQIFRFGERLADLVDDAGKLSNTDFILKLERENGVVYLETSDENKCNWMMFVRPAKTYAEQNLVAYQYGADISFTTIRDIEPKQELKVRCEDCQTSYTTSCSHHQQQPIYDKLVVSRAWASLPPQLQIFRFGERLELGVFAKKAIPKRIQFGPFVADLVDDAGKLSNTDFILKLERENGVVYLETSDENKCNWMMFVRPAKTYAEQNLVAYQYGADISFTTIRDIEPKQELKVWYAAHYAEHVGLKTHQVSEADQEALEEANLRWPCYECDKKFRTSAQLQRHLAVHDDTVQESVEDGEEVFDTSGDSQQTTGRSTQRRRRGRSPKKLRDSTSEDPSIFQSWKKKLYLSKLKKYTRDSQKRPIRTLYKRKGKESGGNEWVCIHCDLTFDNPSLLNLHTLTHAAEDVGLEEIRRLAGEITENGNATTSEMNTASNEMGEAQRFAGLDETKLECPVCKRQFEQKQQLIEHASEHAKTRRHRHDSNPAKPFKCLKCWKMFTVEERLQRHMLCHGDEAAKPLQCNVCFKRFMNNSAVACHMKIHSDRKYYECPLCRLGFDQIHALKVHTASHAVDGVYECPECHKTFTDYNTVRKHMRGFHSDKQYPCPQCNKVFPRPDKLKLHMLRHSNHREFMCENCGRQFKRKDKLKEHMKRMHHPDREMNSPVRPPPAPGTVTKRFVPKVSPADYHRFIYKCHACLLGFKRRGMLVNHLAKRHPDIKTESVPELNLPILQTQRDYYCQYCDKVYKSSSKRKGHILKNHPGAELPASARKKVATCGTVEISGLPNPTFSQTVGSVTTIPHPCEFCHKQYASKAKLMQHQRKKHSDLVPPAVERRKSLPLVYSIDRVKTISGMGTDKLDDSVVIGAPPAPPPDQLQTADLLTQAMSELQQTLNEYRPQVTTTELVPMTPPRTAHGIIGSGTPIVMLQTSAGGQPAMIELSQLQQLAPGQFQVAAPAQVQDGGTAETISQSYVPRTWVPTPYTSYR